MRRCGSCRQVPAHLCFKQSHQFRLHELIIIGYIEADHVSARQRRPKVPLQLGPMRLLHDEDHVGPRDEFGRERVSASWLVPAEPTSKSSRRENTCSAVGLRSLFWLQTNKTDRIRRALNPALYTPRQTSGPGAASAE